MSGASRTSGVQAGLVKVVWANELPTTVAHRVQVNMIRGMGYSRVLAGPAIVVVSQPARSDMWCLPYPAIGSGSRWEESPSGV